MSEETKLDKPELDARDVLADTRRVERLRRAGDALMDAIIEQDLDDDPATVMAAIGAIAGCLAFAMGDAKAAMVVLDSVAAMVIQSETEAAASPGAKRRPPEEVLLEVLSKADSAS